MDEREGSELRTPFFPLGLRKLVMLGVSTFGLYQLRWLYLHWRHIRDAGPEHISPVARSVLLPPVFVFPLAYRIGLAFEPSGARGRALGLGAAAIWAGLVFVLPAMPGLPLPFLFMPLLPVVALQAMANRVNQAAVPGHSPNAQLTRMNMVVVVVGGILVMLAIIASLSEERPQSSDGIPSRVDRVDPATTRASSNNALQLTSGAARMDAARS